MGQNITLQISYLILAAANAASDLRMAISNPTLQLAL